MDVRIARWLASPDGAEAVAQAQAATTGRSSLDAAARLRARLPALGPQESAAALEQAALRELAAQRHGLDATALLLTRDGLEQATRPDVAGRRAASFVAAGARRVVDLTAGLGIDVRAFLGAGLDVVAVERDPATAVLLAANASTADVVVADAADVLPDLLRDLAPTDVVFVDPARRDPRGGRDGTTARARPERDPGRWSPPWPWVAAIDHPRVAAKVAPASDPPPGWQGQWTSWRRTVVETQVASWPLASADRRAVVLDAGTCDVVDADPTRPLPRLLAPGADLPPVLVEPDPAVVRSRAVGALAADLDLRGLDPDSSWLVGEDAAAVVASAAVRGYQVIAELSGSRRDRRAVLRERGVDRLVVKTADVSTSPEAVRRELAVAEGGDHVLVVTRRAGRTLAVLAQPLPRA